MTAFVGYCVADGAFLSADTRRTNYRDNNQSIHSYSTVRKIDSLTSQVVIATGGLGTIGFDARHELIRLVKENNLENDIDGILAETQRVFRRAYEKSFYDNPNHRIPLYAILAGQNPSDGTGFIYSLKSNNDFGISLIKPGNPYFTGSNTHLVQYCATSVYNTLSSRFSYFPLDIWSAQSIRLAANEHNEIGFPIQFVIADSQINEKYPVGKVPMNSDKRYRTSWK